MHDDIHLNKRYRRSLVPRPQKSKARLGFLLLKLNLVVPNPYRGLYDALNLRLGYMQALANHQAPMYEEQAHDGVHLEGSALEPHTTRDLVQDPTLGHPVGHHGI